MALIRCNEGHFYDPSKNTSCPYCGVPGLKVDVAGTVPKSDDPGATTPIGSPRGDAARGNPRADAAPGKTVVYMEKQLGINPTVGWLVCIEGPDRGRDFRIRSGRNFIGRDGRMDVPLANDPGVSREKHAIVSYDPKFNRFKIAPGETAEFTYLNEDSVDVPMELKAHDLIALGETKLLFIPLCGEHFQWKVEDGSAES